MLQTNFVAKIKTHFMLSDSFFPKIMPLMR